ncbi:MAG TPA: MFS transporter, partial [Vicinamibacteria bacterium]
VVPAGLLMVRRPEDLGLASDALASPDRPRRPASSLSAPTPHRAPGVSRRAEPHFTLRQALHTRAFWALALFAALGFMAQAGVSLHQVSHYIRQGFSASMAAMMASLFAVAQVPAGLGWSALTRRVPLRGVLALAGLAVALGVAGMTITDTPVGGALAHLRVLKHVN